jgi:hypothetical protein
VNFITRVFREEIANRRAREIRAAFAKWLASEPQHAIAHVNAKLDEANRAERERLPVAL